MTAQPDTRTAWESLSARIYSLAPKQYGLLVWFCTAVMLFVMFAFFFDGTWFEVGLWAVIYPVYLGWIATHSAKNAQKYFDDVGDRLLFHRAIRNGEYRPAGELPKHWESKLKVMKDSKSLWLAPALIVLPLVAVIIAAAATNGGNLYFAATMVALILVALISGTVLWLRQVNNAEKLLAEHPRSLH